MKKINVKEKTCLFFTSIKERNLISNSESSSPKKDNKFTNFDFKVKYFLIFDKNGLLLVNSAISEFTKLSVKFLDKLKIIVMKIIFSNIQNFETNFKHLKIFFFNENLVYICITSSKTNTCLIRLYLYFLNIVFLNLIGENIKNSACLTNISKIFETFFVSTLTNKFCQVMDHILSNKEKNSCKYLYKFKSLIIYHRNKNNKITLFDYRKIAYRKALKCKYNIRINNVLFNTINNLIIGPIYKNNYITQSEIFSHEIELYSTMPRWMIFGKYFKVYNGLNIIEIFTAKKLSKITKTYKEFEIKHQKSIKDYYKSASRHSHKFIKLVELFTFNYLETISNIVNKYNNPKNELLYFDIDLLIVTNDVISLKLTEEGLINLMYKRLHLYLINKIKLVDQRNSILLEEKNESSSKSENKNISNNKNEEDDYNDEESKTQSTVSTISKSFLQIDSSDIFEEIYQKRKSLQLSSFESNEQIINTSEISEPFQNISYIRNLNNNDAISISSYKSNDSKKVGSGMEIVSLMEKQGGGVDESLNLSKRPTERKMNILKERRSSIGPTFNIIINNNTNNNTINQNILKKRVSLSSFKGIKRNLLMNRRKSLINNSLINKKKERSNSFTESGLFLEQFYSLMNNSKFFKNKHQILKEIENKIASLKRNNSLKDLQSEIKIKISSPFSKVNLKKGKNNDEEKVKNNQSNESKASEPNIQIIKNSSSMLHEENENSINLGKDNGGEIIHEYYGDKSSNNLIINNDKTIFQKLNKKY